jgi:Alpha/beta hydrolase of unknown function (DUF900)
VHIEVKNITKFINHKHLALFSLSLLIIFLMGILQLDMTFAISKTEANKITLYYISTRDPQNFNMVVPLNPEYNPKVEEGYGNDTYLNFSQLKEEACKNKIVTIFVHGWEESEKNVKERLNRVKLSLAYNNYTGPLVGFSWPSDTVWLGAQFIAQANGPKLAKLIYDIKSDCPGADIRIIAHSLGARVVLSSLDSLHKNPSWNDKNFKIKSVHFMGAAVDDEEVSNRSEFILIDQTNWGSAKSTYGQAIQEEVINFYNLFSSEDNMLEPFPDPPSTPIYPIFESDFALGQFGYQKLPDPYTIISTLPTNYNETNVTNELVAICDADGDGYIDLPFKKNQTINVGDNHRGYLGYRESESKITDDGAMNVLISTWNKKPLANINQNLNSSKCHESLAP